MMSAFFSAVSGLKSQTTGLNVISNNISNVNTTGYKSQRASFSDVLSQTLSSASGSSATRGGTNPVQVGLGVQVASTDTNMTTGSTQSTGVATDVAISGDGFFVVSGGTDGNYLYTREGDMTVDEDGNLTVGGYQVCGWMKKDSNGNIITTGQIEPITLYSDDYSGNKKTMAAKITSAAAFSGTLNSTKTANGTDIANIGTVPTTADATSDMTVYDAQGNPYSVTVSWYKCYVDSSDAANPVTSWYYQVDSTSDATLSPSSGYVQFDKNGDIVTSATSALTPTITSTTNPTGYTVGDLTKLSSTALTSGNTYTLRVTAGTTSGTYNVALYDAAGTTQIGTTLTTTDGSGNITDSSGNVIMTLGQATLAAGDVQFSVGTTNFTTAPAITVTPGSSAGTAAFTVNCDLSKIGTSASTAGVTATPDGYTTGTLSGVSIESDGTITGTYSNGETQSLGQMAMATFTNSQGLEKSGENLYKSSSNSGTVAYYTAGNGGTKALSTGCLEMSNVDLAQEFSNMMIAQRAYQANSKVISTADEMLQSLINMR